MIQIKLLSLELVDSRGSSPMRVVVPLKLAYNVWFVEDWTIQQLQRKWCLWNIDERLELIAIGTDTQDQCNLLNDCIRKSTCQLLSDKP